MSTNSARVLASVALIAFPAVALAQSSSTYVPPKLVKPGASTTTAAGAGDVTIQVFVKKDGTFSVNRVLKSSNPLDDAAATEIAKTATYKAGVRDGKPVDAYYDYVIKFTSNGAVASSAGSTGGASAAADASGPTAAAYADIRAGKYADAKAQLQAYLQTHPGDPQASTLLGVADGFSGDDVGAAQAFDSVPAIPDQYKTLASQSYAKAAAAYLNQGKNADAGAAAAKVIALSPDSPEGYYLRGIASGNQQNFAAALPDLQKALALAKSAAKPDNKTLATIEFSLAVAQYNTGAYDQGSVSAKDVVRLDPSQQAKLDQAAFVAVSNDAIGLANAGKVGDAVARFENGAVLFPSSAGAFYGQAAYIMLTQKSPDYKQLKAEADKALAIDPTNGKALFVNAFVAANGGDTKTAIADMTKAKASPAYSSDPGFAKQVDDNLKKLSASG
jgi:tetratricopeptide (TPR) repeat protein